MGKRTIRIALGQFRYEQGQPEANLNKMLDMIAQAADAGADIIAFPELSYSGYFCPLPLLQQIAETVDGLFVKLMCQKASEKRVHILAGYPERGEDGKIYNSAVFIDDEGNLLENMRKVYLWGSEKKRFSAGHRFPVVETKFGKIGILLCADMEYPEPARIEMLKGAELIFDCAAWSIHPAEHRWFVYTQATALYNLLFVAGCNTVDDNVCGSSVVVGPDGVIRAQASRTEEEILLHEIDLNEVLEIRSRIPYMNDFKRDTFSESALVTY